MPSKRPGPTLADSRPRSAAQRRRRRLTALLVLAVVVTGGWFGARYLIQSVASPKCTITAAGSTETFDPEQTGNAALIAALSVKRGMPPRAATIAITTAFQESKIRNLRYGDRDSLGLFQQRPSQGWGTAEQILDPEFSTNKFYDALEKIKGYQTMDIAQAAQKVQRSAAGGAYAQHEAQARVTASTLSGQTHNGIVCALEDPATPGDPAEVAALVEKDFGVSAEEGKDTVTFQADSADRAWAVASWAVARANDTGANRGVVGDRKWRRGMQDSALDWQT